MRVRWMAGRREWNYCLRDTGSEFDVSDDEGADLIARGLGIAVAADPVPPVVVGESAGARRGRPRSGDDE